jgi:hypothetical protein
MSVLTKQAAVIRCCLIAALSGYSAYAFATSNSTGRPIYGFVQLGSYEQDLQGDFQTGLGVDSGFSAQSISFDVDDRGSNWSAGLGYQILPWLAAELSYSDFDSLTLEAVSSLPNARVFSAVQTQAISLDAVAQWEFAPSWQVSARLGAAQWDAELTSAVTEPRELANQAQLDDNDVSIKFGFALAYQFTEQLAASLHLDQFQVDSEKLGIDTPIRALGARLTWRF